MQVKCEKYWPDSLGEAVPYGDINVLLKTEDVREEYTLRLLDVSHVSFNLHFS